MSRESEESAHERIGAARAAAPHDAAANGDVANDDATLEQVRRKAARMRRGRRSQPTLWRYLAHVGVLGWLFILPVVGLAAFGRWLGRALSEPRLALAGLLAGLGLGAYLVWRSVQRSLSDSADSDHEDTDDHDAT